MDKGRDIRDFFKQCVEHCEFLEAQEASGESDEQKTEKDQNDNTTQEG